MDEIIEKYRDWFMRDFAYLEGISMGLADKEAGVAIRQRLQGVQLNLKAFYVALKEVEE